MRLCPFLNRHEGDWHLGPGHLPQVPQVLGPLFRVHGYGTQDELFETLVLVQTGRSNMVPLVLMEGQGGAYWRYWDQYIRKNLLANGWIDPEDPDFYYLAPSVEAAVRHVLGFYRLYHSSRYVGENLVIRLLSPISSEQLEQLNDEFAVLLQEGRIQQGPALAEEDDHLDLPRLVFHHRRHRYGVLRAMIDRINGFAAADPIQAESVH